MRACWVLAASLFVPCVTSCVSSDNSASDDLAGGYSITLTNASNDCELDSFPSGETTQGSLTISQGSDQAIAELSGYAAAPFQTLLGGAALTGSASNGAGHFLLYGTPQFKLGDCDYRLNAELGVARDGDRLVGTVAWTAVTDHAASCGVLETCRTIQNLDAALQ
jgi:hypothetical protein